MCPNFPQTISRPPPKCPNLSPINASPFQKAWTCPKSVLTKCIDFSISSNPLQCTRTYPKLTLTPSEVHGLVPNQIYPFQTVQLCPKEVLTSPKCLNLCQIHCDPSKVSELVTNQFYIPQKCPDWSQISSNPLQNPKTFSNQFYLLPVLISCNSL